jgi:hypothetical protein
VAAWVTGEKFSNTIIFSHTCFPKIGRGSTGEASVARTAFKRANAWAATAGSARGMVAEMVRSLGNRDGGRATV